MQAWNSKSTKTPVRQRKDHCSHQHAADTSWGDQQGTKGLVGAKACESPVMLLKLTQYSTARSNQERTNWTGCEAPGTLSRTICTVWEAPGRQLKGLIGQVWEAPGRQERTNWTTWEAPGRQERTNWTGWEAPGRQERTIWTAWEAPGRQERTSWTGWEAPGRQERTIWTAWEAPGSQERTIWTAWEAPGKHQEAPGAVKGNSVLLEVRMTVEGFPPQF